MMLHHLLSYVPTFPSNAIPLWGRHILRRKRDGGKEIRKCLKKTHPVLLFVKGIKKAASEEETAVLVGHFAGQ
ncbi:hypothetical protein NL676_008981 [Syzygium grande]|nr:hypothetical protein NL676_008981 [Syzygium grande]